MTALAEAIVVAGRREAQHELWCVLGGPGRWHHRRADQTLDLIDRADEVLSGAMEVIRWG